MSIRKKFCLTLVSSLLALFLLFSALSIALFRDSTKQQLQRSMETLISYNTSSLNAFTTSIHQVALHLVSDKAFGELLSFESERTIEQLENRDALYIQFTHYSLFYNTEYSRFQNTLFLNETLPSAAFFPVADMAETTREGSYRIYKDTLVKEQGWFKAVDNTRAGTYVVYDEDSERILFVRRLQNTYYTGPWSKAGIGTLVISIKPDDFVDLLSMRFLTPNSAYLIRNADNEVILQKNTTEALAASFEDGELAGKRIESDGGDIVSGGQEWKVSSRELRNDLEIIYLTPVSDVNALIWNSIRPSIVTSALLMILTAAVAFIFSDYFTAPIISLSQDISGITDTENYNPEIFEKYKDQELQAVCRSFDDMMNNANRLNRARQASERRSREMELRSLQAQINPHFLFNAMDLVNWIALSRDQDDLADIVANIAEILRYSITEADSLIPVEDEIRISETYLSVYRLRYGNVMQFTYPPEEELDYFIPKFCLQPLVENSIRHSSETHDKPLHIELTHQRDGDNIVLRLSDDGRGNDPELLNRFLRHEKNVPLKVSHGFGIRNVNERLQLKFQMEGSLHYEMDDEGRLTAVLVFPYITDSQQYMRGIENAKKENE